MVLKGLDVIGASLAYREQLGCFAAQHWAARPWLRDMARHAGAAGWLTTGRELG